MTGLKWSRRTTDKIAALLAGSGILVSSNTVGRLLHQMGYSLRVNHKMIPADSSPDREQQFEYISKLRTRFQNRQHPIISVDTKKRELVGNFKNQGTRWDTSPILVNDHDFRTIKYNNQGSPQWLNLYTSPIPSDNIPTAMTVDASDNVYVTGESGPAGYSDFQTIKYSSAGAQLWVKRIGNTVT